MSISSKSLIHCFAIEADDRLKVLSYEYAHFGRLTMFRVFVAMLPNFLFNRTLLLQCRQRNHIDAITLCVRCSFGARTDFIMDRKQIMMRKQESKVFAEKVSAASIPSFHLVREQLPALSFREMLHLDQQVCS